MTIVETVLVFVGIPAGTVGAFAAVILGPGAVRAPRYRPGAPWDYKAVWYLPHPGVSSSSGHGASPDAIAARGHRALTGAGAATIEASGGASGEW